MGMNLAMRPPWSGVCGWQFTGQGNRPTDGDTQVIRRATTQPVRSIKGQRPTDRCFQPIGFRIGAATC
jgi:hypothetical protein